MSSVKFSLESVELSSAEHLAEFLKTSFVHAYSGVHSRENIESYCTENYTLKRQREVLSNPDYNIYFARKTGKAVGVLVIHHHACPLRPTLKSSELKQLYLLESEFGSGLGKNLIERSFEIVRDHGQDWIWLCVSDRNHRAKRFYEKYKFKRIGEGPILNVGTDRLSSSILIRKLN